MNCSTCPFYKRNGRVAMCTHPKNQYNRFSGVWKNVKFLSMSFFPNAPKWCKRLGE